MKTWTLALLLLAGCGHDAMTEHPFVYASDSMDLEAVKRAAEAWHEAAPEVDMDVIVAPDDLVRKAAEKDVLDNAVYVFATHDTKQTGCPWSSAPVDATGITHRSYATGSAVVCVDIDEGNLDRALAHELGHALRLVHTGEGTLMVNAYEGPQSPQPADVGQLRGIWGAR